MPVFSHAAAALTAALLIPWGAYAHAGEFQRPCEAYSQSGDVFVGVAAAPVTRLVQLPNHGPIEMRLTPVTVERAYLGTATSIMYLTPLGAETYATPGRKYLVYGRTYRPPDIVMAGPGYGAIEIERAAEDLAFLDRLTPGVLGGAVEGVVRQRTLTYGSADHTETPLPRIRVRIFNETHSIDVVADAQGRFLASGVPAGLYELTPDLPDDLVVWDPTSHIRVLVRDGGCATTTIAARINGRVRGVLRGPDGRPLTSTSVDLMPMDVAPEPRSGYIMGTGSVSTSDKGEFEFAGVPAGRYYLGVNLYNSPNPHGPSYPRTYYPGTTDRNNATPVVVERGRVSDGFELTIPVVLPKGEVEILVETEHPGTLKVCFVPLENLFHGWSSWEVRPGVPTRNPVVDGQRYEVHVHLEYPGGHLESEPYVFTGTTLKTVVTLRPDAPRNLHR